MGIIYFTFCFYSSANGASATKVDAICTYVNSSGAPRFDQVAFFKELANKTNGVTSLGIYSLDPNSLYVNGYSEAASKNPTTPINSFTVNVSITNLPYTSNMGTPNTSLFNSTRLIMNTVINSVVNQTTLNFFSPVCQTIRFSSANGARATKVDAICTYVNSSGAPRFDQVAFFKELANKTKGVTSLGIYSLDPNSLYVNGYNEAASVESPIEAATKVPVDAASSEEITLNVTILNLAYTSELASKYSLKYNSTSTNMLYLVNNLMKNSTLGSQLINCLLDSFVFNAVGTKVNLVCNIKKDATGLKFDAGAFYNEVSSMTLNVTKLSIYKLDANSLYVNGYNKAMATTTTKSPSLTTFRIFGPRQFFLNFTITNLNFNASLANKTSGPFIILKSKLDNLLNEGFKYNSRVKDNFEICEVIRLRSTPESVDTTVEAICTFNMNLLARTFTENDIQNSLLEITQNGTTLGNFTLSRSSIHVDVFRVDVTTTASSSITTTASAIIGNLPSSAFLGFNINFTILNNSVPDDPTKRQMLEEDITNKMNGLYQNSTLSKQFKYCLLSSIRNGSIIVSCNCYFQDDPVVNRKSVQDEFNQGSDRGRILGLIYPLKDITVTEIPRNYDLPFWAIILICLAVLLVLVLLFLIIFLLIYCLKGRRDSYDIHQNIYETYFPHLDMRKLY
ncbi:mucin-16-like [Rana temporaria]|uniref:mucin-16-like n=1 Tax=Rana temporaria TaxID=8407 RepID=UPI001AAD2CBF|nr:mucin-16-like [Rana temporaria]